MITYKHSLSTLLIVAVMVTIGAGVPTIAAHAASTSKADKDAKEVKVRKEEENRIKKQDKSYTKQAKAMADQYAQTAKLVARNGGNPGPLLDAAAYFDKESK
jgi:hypothetical protein